MFSISLDNFLPFSSNLKLSSANSFSLEESKICRLVMGEMVIYCNFLSNNVAVKSFRPTFSAGVGFLFPVRMVSAQLSCLCKNFEDYRQFMVQRIQLILKICLGQVNYPPLSNCRTSANWQEDMEEF